jgi:AraC-like DNA-binding protein
MSVTEEKSRAELSAFIESYWRYEGHPEDDLLLFPDGTFSLLVASHGFACGAQCFSHGIYLLPIHLNAVSIQSAKVLMGIRFKAFSLPNLFPAGHQDLSGFIALKELGCTPALHALSREILTVNDPEKSASLLQLLAYELLSTHFSVRQSLREKVNYVLDRKGQIRIEEMAAHFSVSRQALHKHFTSALKVSPKQLSAVWQLNHFFTLAQEEKESLTSNALDAGYYDQAHFIRQFSSRFGVAPGTFLRTNQGILSFAKDSMIKRFTHYYDPE